MAFHLVASHIQEQRAAEVAHERLVALARAASGPPPLSARVRAAIGLVIVQAGLALGGETARRRAHDAARSRTSLA